MAILIIGSDGFIGSNLVNYFNTQHEKVIGADIKAIQRNDYYQINPTDPNYDELFANHSFTICINASGSANVKFSFDQPKLDFDSNTLSVFKLLNSIKKHQPNCKFLNLSSAAVYGNFSTEPLAENIQCNPVSPYGFHKWYAELICKEYHVLFNLKTISVRLFSVYGEGQEKLLFWDMWQKYKANKNNIELFGTGNEARDFLHIEDVVKAIDVVYKKEHFNGGAINIASGKTTTIKEAATTFFELLPAKNAQYSFTHHAKKGDPDILAADISKLQQLGFTPTFNLHEGLSKYMQWLQEKK